MKTFGQTRERSGAAAAHAAARAGLAIRCRRPVLPTLWGCGGGDTTCQGDGGDERDEGLVEQHCQEWLGLMLKVLYVCRTLRNLELLELPFYKISSIPS